jgi:N-succinyldiaminopimelate aminotransferase
MPAQVQRASVAAWADETHVRANRTSYREKFSALTPILGSTFTIMQPEGGFYHWIPVAEDDQHFALELFKATNITVLPGSFIGRESNGINPGAGHIRVAWVADLKSCLEAATRLVEWASA